MKLIKTFLPLLLIGTAFASSEIVTPLQDASVRDGINNVNERSKVLEVFDSNSVERSTFIEFDFSTLDSDIIGDDINSATLKLYVQAVLRPGEITMYIGAQDWDDSTITGNNYPSTIYMDGGDTYDIQSSEKRSYIEIDITDVTKDWLDGDKDNEGIHILATKDDGARIKFASSENTSRTPKIVLEIADSMAIGYENISLSMINSDYTATSDFFVGEMFSPMVKTTFSEVQLWIEWYGGQSYSGYLGVAIYENESMSGDSYPKTLVGSAMLPNIGAYGYYPTRFEFESPVTVRPGTDYWFVIGYDDRGGGMELGAFKSTLDSGINSAPYGYEDGPIFSDDLDFAGFAEDGTSYGGWVGDFAADEDTYRFHFQLIP